MSLCGYFLQFCVGVSISQNTERSKSSKGIKSLEIRIPIIGFLSFLQNYIILRGTDNRVRKTNANDVLLRIRLFSILYNDTRDFWSTGRERFKTQFRVSKDSRTPEYYRLHSCILYDDSYLRIRESGFWVLELPHKL